MERLDRIRFVELRHLEYEFIREFCDNEDSYMRWAIGDMWYDWTMFNKMKKGDVLIVKIHKGGTHCFPESELIHYVDSLNPSMYIKITCYEDRDGKPDYEGYDYTIEPYDLEEGD